VLCLPNTPLPVVHDGAISLIFDFVVCVFVQYTRPRVMCTSHCCIKKIITVLTENTLTF